MLPIYNSYRRVCCTNEKYARQRCRKNDFTYLLEKTNEYVTFKICVERTVGEIERVFVYSTSADVWV